MPIYYLNSDDLINPLLMFTPAPKFTEERREFPESGYLPRSFLFVPTVSSASAMYRPVKNPFLV